MDVIILIPQQITTERRVIIHMKREQDGRNEVWEELVNELKNQQASYLEVQLLYNEFMHCITTW